MTVREYMTEKWKGQELKIGSFLPYEDDIVEIVEKTDTLVVVVDSSGNRKELDIKTLKETSLDNNR